MDTCLFVDIGVGLFEMVMRHIVIKSILKRNRQIPNMDTCLLVCEMIDLLSHLDRVTILIDFLRGCLRRRVNIRC